MNRIVIASLLVLCTSCLGNKAKTTALIPAMDLAWDGVHSDMERGWEDGLAQGDLVSSDHASLIIEADTLGLAIDEKDISTIREVRWSLLSPWVTRGIQARVDSVEIGEGVAASLRERLLNFTQAMGAVQQKITALPAPSRPECCVAAPGVASAVYAGSDRTAPLASRWN